MFGEKNFDKIMKKVTVGNLSLKASTTIFKAGLNENKGVPYANVVLAR